MRNRTLIAVVLCILFCIALFLRTYESGAVGLSEDEANKAQAIESYRNGNYLANGEHPMFMKLMSWASVAASDRWNAWFPQLRISPEAALRFPAALAGSLMVFAIYLLGMELFSPAIGLIAASVWAVDINSVALSRIAKEDVIVALFFVLGNYFLLRGKRFHFTDTASATRNYVACGASFGMLLGTKYIIPYPWITLIFYDLFRFRPEPRWRLTHPALLKLYGAFLVAFILFNPIILKPETLDYLWRHFTHGRLAHNGYYMMGELYLNKAYYTFWGMPVYFYPLYFFVKTPLTMLIAFCVGFVYCIRRFRQDHSLFLVLYFVLWLILITLPGGKFTRYAITLLPAVILMQALGLYSVYTALRNRLVSPAQRWIPSAIMAVLLGITAGWYLVLDRSYHPYYSFYVAKHGGGKAKWGYYFPPDDFYDAGLREGIAYIGMNAPPNSVVVGNTPMAFEYYQKSFGRPDLRFHAMTRRPLEFGSEPCFIIFQDYRRYIENNYLLVFTKAELKPLFVTSVKEVPSAEIYYLSPDPMYIKSPFWKANHWPGVLAPLAKLTPAK